MAINWSSAAFWNPNAWIFRDLDLDQQASSQLTPQGYSSDFVETELWWVWKMPLFFEWKNYNATPGYLWLAGIVFPSAISGLPNNLWYMRSAAYSIAESYGQLRNMTDTKYTNDQILELIIVRVLALFHAEIERIEEYMSQKNFTLSEEQEKKFEAHLESLKYYSDVLFSNSWWIKTQNTVQSKKGNVEEIMQPA